MKANMAVADRIVRIVIALLVAIGYFTGVLSGAWAIVLGIVAVIFLATSIVGFCPLYALLRISTKRAKSA